MCARLPRSLLAALGIAALFSSSACHIAGAKAWNLEQVHRPDGTHKRRGRVQTDLAYLFGNALRRSNFGGETFQEEQEREKRLKDPPGVCLENLIELGRCKPDQEVTTLQAASFSWLAVECSSQLSRERSVLELGELAQRLELPQRPVPASEPPYADAELVTQHFETLLATVREVVAAPDLAGDTLVQACQAVHELSLDRAGGLRLLRASNALLERGEQGAVLAPLRALRLDLARRTVAMALREAREDEEGLVRAAALEAGVRAFPRERSELLRWGLLEPMEGVAGREEISLRALELLARYGLPAAPAGADAEEERRVWIERLVQSLRTHFDGRHATAACRALARASGEPENLRPEVWVAWWQAASSPPRESGVTP